MSVIKIAKCNQDNCKNNSAFTNGDQKYCLKHIPPEFREIYELEQKELEEELDSLKNCICGCNDKEGEDHDTH